MSQARTQRRLAAILAADVVGYSKHMQTDEVGTLARLKLLRRELIDPQIEAHGGRIVKLMGDGMLIEFPSLVDAAECAVAVQQGVAGANASQTEAHRLAFRVGLNLGDVIIDGDDIHGDGVNVAARLEGLAETGGICISDDAYRQVRGKIEAEFVDGGAQPVKNIAEPVRVWHWAPGQTDTPSAEAAAAEPLALPDKPSIAVLPFDNMSGDPDQEFFADGMAEDIITALSRMPWFFVIARNSSFTYKGQAVDVKDVAADLGVQYVLEGSVRRGGDRLRITAQLIDALSGNHVWAERYDRQIADIFDVQDEVTQAIVGAIAPEFLAVEAKRARRKDAGKLDAWECVMRGRAHLWKFGREDAAEARKLFERAIELAPSGEFGASDLALVHFLESYYRWSDSPAQSFEAMIASAEQAVAADDHDPWALTILAWAKIFARRWEEARTSIDRAVALSPNFAPAVGFKGGILALLGEIEESLTWFDEARRLSPRDTIMGTWMMGEFWAHYALESYEHALRIADAALRLAPGNPTYRRQRAAALAMLGRDDEARSAMADYLTLEPNHTLADVGRLPSKNTEYLARFIEGLRRAGLPEAPEDETSG
jgi:adenylate cyclase